MVTYYVKVVNGSVVNRAVFDGDLPPDWPDAEQWHNSDVAQIGWSFTGGEFIAPPPAEPAPPDEPVRRLVYKSVIIERLFKAGKLVAAKQALDSDVYNRERWYAPDRPGVYADDPDTLELLQAIGADAETILAP